jgi:nitrate/nitrite-specific signal transduction histidine kinase
VEIGSEEDEKEYRFYVKDNGVGIDQSITTVSSTCSTGFRI